ncbi:MAG: hypothetical protein ACLQQM_02835 [Acidimicrobiales bacterium]
MALSREETIEALVYAIGELVDTLGVDLSGCPSLQAVRRNATERRLAAEWQRTEHLRLAEVAATDRRLREEAERHAEEWDPVAMARAKHRLLADFGHGARS